MSNELRQCVVEEWEWHDKYVIDSAIRQWRCRLRTYTKARGGHFEHTVKAQTLNNCCFLYCIDELNI